MSEKKLLPFLLVSGMDATFSMTYSLTHIKKDLNVEQFSCNKTYDGHFK